MLQGELTQLLKKFREVAKDKRDSKSTVLAIYYRLKSICILLQSSSQSWVPNKRGGHNKRVGWKIFSK